MWRWLVGCGALAALLAGCGSSRISAERGASQEGVASWYGPGFHGKPTTSGEVYDQQELTAAHQTLPLGTRVAVTNLQNGKQVEVRVNDRGPFAKSRVIDVSYAAARALDMVGPGTAPVRIEVLGDAETRFVPLVYTVQVGSFGDRDNAMRLKTVLDQRFDAVHVSRLDGPSSHYYRVRVGRFTRREEALQTAQSLTPLGLAAIIVEDGVP